MSGDISTTALERAGASVTDNALRLINPASLTWEDYEGLGDFLGALGRAYPFWVGDFLNIGEDVFGERFAQIEVNLPHSPQTLANYKSVSKQIPPSRRRKGLSYSTHAEVAYLLPAERDALLAQAAKEGWKREEMREARRAMQGEPIGELPPGKPKTKCPSCGHTWEV